MSNAIELDEGARGWLGQIEARKKELDQLEASIREEEKRRSKLKSPKFQAKSDALLEQLCTARAAARKFVEDETRLFFQKVFGILEASPVAVADANGQQTAGLLATELGARQLANGIGVFTVAGDALEADLAAGLPRPEYLLVQEGTGKSFVVLG